MKKKRKSNGTLVIIPLLLILLSVISILVIDSFGIQVVSQVKTFISAVFYIYVIGACFVVFFEEKEPQRMMSWLLVLILFPGFGLVAYFAFGRSFRKRHRVKKKKLDEQLNWSGSYNRKDLSCIDDMNYEVPDINRTLIKLLQNNSDSNLLLFNEVEVMADGVVTFAKMLEALENAKKIINFQFFIVKDDELGQRFKHVLIQRAQAGVEVNFLYDAVGSWKLSKKYISELEVAGVNVLSFLPVIAPFVSREVNYRNHRKILTIDNIVGFVGGLNIGDEYLGKVKYFGYWRDTHLQIKGESVYALSNIFNDDWEFSGGEITEKAEEFLAVENMTPSLMQIAASGPDSDKNVIMQAYFKMISTAKDYVYITTPYLVPEESLIVALKTAALSGVDVRIIIPYIADHMMVYWANQSNIEALLESKVKIYYYKKGFIHSKSLMIDEVCASVGTANLDFRSMELNFEVNAFLYDKKVVTQLREDFEEDLSFSEEIILENFKNRKAYRKVLEAFGRLVSPLQ